MAGVLPPVLGTNLRLHGAACAALAPNACVVHHLGASQLSFDSTIGAAKMAVRFRESLEARLWPDGLVADALCAEVWPDDSATPPPGAALLTLGHQQDAHGAMPCPASASLAQPPSPRLAAVALVVDLERRCILLTRRSTVKVPWLTAADAAAHALAAWVRKRACVVLALCSGACPK